MRRTAVAGRRRRGDLYVDEAGLTVPELVVTIVIMGLIIGPLAMALSLALNIIPTSGARAHAATDVDRLHSVFTNDVTQAQRGDINVFTGGLPAYPVDGYGKTTGPPTNSTVTTKFAMNGPTSWTYAPPPPAPWNFLRCPPTLNATLSNNGGLWVPIFDVAWSDGLDPSTGLAKSTPDVLVTYQALFQNSSAGIAVEFHRFISTSGGVPTDQGSYASGYCQPGVDIVAAPGMTSTDRQQDAVSFTFWFRGSQTGTLDTYAVSATTRPSGTA